MADIEAHDELMAVVKKYSHDLTPEDLRTLADRLETTAEKWEDLQ